MYKEGSKTYNHLTKIFILLLCTSIDRRSTCILFYQILEIKKSSRLVILTVYNEFTNLHIYKKRSIHIYIPTT